MSFFESLLLLLLAAVILLQVARRMALPYPAMLAVAGVAAAYVPGAPNIRIDPQTTLALFIAPVLLDAAYDFPVASARMLWRPLTVLAGGAVLATAAAVTMIGVWTAGLPIAAAVVLGAIVAPPDAAAAVAVLSAVSLPRRTVGVLKGESLFNDAVALLLFGGALEVQTSGGLSAATALRLAVAVPGGLALGVAAGFVMGRVSRWVGASLGGNILQFLSAFLVWIAADQLHLSAVLAVVASAMTVSRLNDRGGSARMRVHSFAVWASVVFVLNVLAFLMMGMQARVILGHMSQSRLLEAGKIAALIVVALIVTRIVYVIGWNRLAVWSARLRGPLPPPTFGQGVAVAWSGMRGLVTLATAFALPSDFPQRDLVVLTAFGVVLATLVLQGLTLAPLIRWLKLDRLEDPAADLADARRTLAEIARDRAEMDGDLGDLSLAELYRLKSLSPQPQSATERLQQHRRLGLDMIAAQREALLRMRDEHRIDMDAYYLLQEEVDWRELTLLPDEQRRIDEI